jgi:hypothetical protein
VPARSAGRVFPQNRRFSPGLIIFEVLLFGGMCAVLVSAAFVTHSEGDRSSLVQHYGISRTGTVTAVHNTEHSSRGGSYYTSDIDVSLVSPGAAWRPPRCATRAGRLISPGNRSAY